MPQKLPSSLIKFLIWLFLLFIPLQIYADATPSVYEPYRGQVIFNNTGQPPPVPIKKPARFNPCSCVSYARWVTGINVGPIGLAKNHPVNSDFPIIGGMVVFRGSTGHLAVVTRIDVSTFHIKEYNYRPCAYSERDIPFGSINIKGFYN